MAKRLTLKTPYLALPHIIKHIYNNGTDEVIRRGKKIHSMGFVELVEHDELMGNIVFRVKDDSYSTFYKVYIQKYADARLISLRCGCPYNLGEICRHEAAALFRLQDMVDKNMLGSTTIQYNQQHTVAKMKHIDLKMIKMLSSPAIYEEAETLLRTVKATILKSADERVEAELTYNGYTCAGGVEIYFEDVDDAAIIIWDAIFKAGEAQGIKPIGLGARDTLRLEKGFCLYGNDIDDTTSPIAAGLGWITKFTKDFVSRETFEKQKANGVSQKLVGFEMIEKGIARHDYEIKDFEGNTIGRVTSGTQSPTLGKAIGMGYVDVKYAPVDSEIFIKVRTTLLKARVVKIPFV